MRVFNVEIGDVLLVQMITGSKYIMKVAAFNAESFIGPYRDFNRVSGRYDGPAFNSGIFIIRETTSVRRSNLEHF